MTTTQLDAIAAVACTANRLAAVPPQQRDAVYERDRAEHQAAKDELLAELDDTPRS